MQPAEEPSEPEQSYPSGYSRPLWLNGGLLALIIGLIMLAQGQEGYLGGLGYILAVVALSGLGALINLILALTARNGRGICWVAAVLLGAFFGFLWSALGHIGKIGG